MSDSKQVEDLKKARSDAKRTNTLAMRKLDGLINVGSDDETLKKQVEIVETSYDKLLSICYDYLDSVGEEEGEDYLKTSTDEYYRLMTIYNNLMKASKEIEKKKKENALKREVERGFIKIRSTIDRIESENCEEMKISELEEDKCVLDLNLKTLIDSLSDLSIFEDISLQNKEINNLLPVCEKLKRTLNITIREKSSNTFDDKKSFMNSSLSKMPSPETVLPKSFAYDKTFGDSKGEINTEQVRYKTSNSLSLTSTEDANHFTSASVHSDHHMSPVYRDTVTSSRQSVYQNKLSDHGYTNALPSSSISFSSFHMPHQTHSPSMYDVNHRSTFTSSVAHLSTPSPSVLTAYQDNAFSQPSIYAQSPFMSSAPLSSMQAVHQTLPMPPQLAYPYSSLNEPRAIPLSMQTNSQEYSPWNHNTIHTKRPSLPIFSGERSDWPEFRVVWKSLAEGQFRNKMQLALELKRCCPKGRAFESLNNVYVTSEEAYEEMWRRLEEDYGDPGLSVQCALGQLTTIRNVNEGDYRSLVKCIDKIESVHNQLKELGQLCAVHMVDIDRVTQKLPREVNMNWQRRYRDLGEKQKLEPFAEFMSFLKKERAVVMRLSESLLPSEKRPARTHLTESNFALSDQADRSKDNCIIHGKGHLTSECKVFGSMSIKEKYDKLREKHHCFNCLKKHFQKDCRYTVKAQKKSLVVKKT